MTRGLWKPQPGLAEDCQLRRAIAEDQVLTYDDVDVPAGRLVDDLRAKQAAHFARP